MSKEQLTITVSGVCGSGKSRLTYLLKQFLRSQGFDVNQELNMDHPTESNFDKSMERNISDCLDMIKESRIITLKEVQTRRS